MSSVVVLTSNSSAGKAGRAREAVRSGILMMTAVSFVLTAIVFAAGEPLIALFGLSQETTAIGGAFFNRIAAFYIVFGLSTAIRGYLEGIGDMLFSGILGISSLAVRIACSYIFRGVFGNMVIAYAEIFAWLFMLAVYTLRYMRKRIRL